MPNVRSSPPTLSCAGPRRGPRWRGWSSMRSTPANRGAAPPSRVRRDAHSPPPRAGVTMHPRSSLAALLLASGSVVAPTRAGGQISKLIDNAKKQVNEAKGNVADARSIRCDVQGICGDIKQSPNFKPQSYESVAVTVFDGSGAFRAPGTLGMVRDAFESRLVANGYLLAASSDAKVIREKIAREDNGWTDEDLRSEER